jgi:predicted DNA binding CopG/RHH family protein
LKEKSVQKKGPEKIDGIKQMAEYFDHTDTEELEWEDTDLRFERPEMAHISVRIPKTYLITIKKAARDLGLGYTAYVRMLLHKSATSSKAGR